MVALPQPARLESVHPAFGNPGEFLDSVVAGLVTNALTEFFLLFVAVLGGYLSIIDGLAVLLLGAPAWPSARQS